MSSWTYALTNKGRQLQAKAQTGIKLEYTRMAVGSGTLAGQSLAAMTALITPVKDLPIIRLKHPEGSTRALVGATLTNADVTIGFYFREIGIYATDPDDGEILYMYANSGATADYIAPSGDGIIQKSVNMNVIVGTAQNVTAIINESLVYVTREEFEEAIENIDVDIPDASLTVKGKVQLSDKTDGTSQSLAATEKAVKAAYDRGSTGVTAAATAQAKADAALPKGIPDTRNVPTKPSDYKTNVAYNFKTGSVVGLPAEQFVVIHGLKGWHDDSGGVTHEYASGGTTGRMYHRTGTSANDTWAPWMQIIDNGASWQKVRVTSDSGYAFDISFANLNDPRNTGFYMGNQVANAPSSDWYFFEIVRHNELWEMQVAYNFNRTTFQQRWKRDGNWTPWSEDLFQSGVNAKQGIVDAINAKGGSASTNDTWAVLADKIRALSMFKAGDYELKTLSNGGATYNTYPSMGSYFKPSIGGTFRVSFTLFAQHTINGASAYAQIYVNGIPRGTQRSVNNNTGGQRFSEDITINTGDTIQLYIWSGNDQNIAEADFFTLASDFNVQSGS